MKITKMPLASKFQAIDLYKSLKVMRVMVETIPTDNKEKYFTSRYTLILGDKILELVSKETNFIYSKDALFLAIWRFIYSVNKRINSINEDKDIANIAYSKKIPTSMKDLPFDDYLQVFLERKKDLYNNIMKFFGDSYSDFEQLCNLIDTEANISFEERVASACTIDHMSSSIKVNDGSFKL